jgi:preprotein translocase subunit YajC
MEFLNEYSGLFSLLAVVASVIVPFWIYRKQKKEQEKYYYMQKNDQEHFYNLQKKTKNISIKSNKTTIFKT